MIVEAIVLKTKKKVLLIDSARGLHFCSDGRGYRPKELRIIRYDLEEKKLNQSKNNHGASTKG